MNAHKLNIKSTRLYKKCIKKERQEIKNRILYAAGCGKKKTEYFIDCPENLEWLKEKGFKFEEYKNSIHRYLISWEGC